VIPGVVFSGTTDGVMHAYATADGTLLWEYNTAHDYETVNGVAGKGGSINGPGPVITGGLLFTNSGYGYTNAAGGGNVLLAFGVDFP
jgi:polyvinyl alcohol dehydrogenase (cytochrome)